MAKYVTLKYIKAHSRIDYDCEDSLLELYAEAAEESVAGLLNRGKTVDEMVSSLTEEYGKLPSSIIHATLMLVENSYNHRDPSSPTAQIIVPYGFDLSVKQYMKLTSNP